MSSINIINIVCKNPTDSFTSQFKFEIVFECLSELSQDIEFKLIYIGKAEDTNYDQELESVVIGPLQLGQMKFDFEADAPDITKIPKDDVLGITAIILNCSYNNQEYFRVGYYVNNHYQTENENSDIPEVLDPSKIIRQINNTKPRITKFKINWDSNCDTIPGYNSHNDMFSNLEETKKEMKDLKEMNFNKEK